MKSRGIGGTDNIASYVGDAMVATGFKPAICDDLCATIAAPSNGPGWIGAYHGLKWALAVIAMR